jgi:hypothetical protein
MNSYQTLFLILAFLFVAISVSLIDDKNKKPDIIDYANAAGLGFVIAIAAYLWICFVWWLAVTAWGFLTPLWT